jgi:hypothetical protein
MVNPGVDGFFLTGMSKRDALFGQSAPMYFNHTSMW